MLLVKTYLDKSPIHGLGVFAAERIPRGAKIWRFVEGFDRAYTPKQFARLPKAARDFLKNYAYKVDGEILFTVDNDHHMNHAEQPNTVLRGGYVIAAVDIPKGAEITNDYREFDPALCAAFLKKPANGKAVNGKALNGKARSGSAVNGKALSNKVLNGKSLNGKSLNGKSLNGKALNGKALNGKTLNGAMHAKANGKTNGRSHAAR